MLSLKTMRQMIKFVSKRFEQLLVWKNQAQDLHCKYKIKTSNYNNTTIDQ